MRETYYSEKLDKYFDSKKECLEAEDTYDKKQLLVDQAKEEKRKAAKEVEELYKAAAEAKDKADKALSEFIDKYGSFHTTITDSSLTAKPFGLFDLFFDTPFFL